jgi:DNA-binding MarR family transcriptional regulator
MLSLRELPRVEVLEADARKFSSLDPPTLLAFLSVFVTATEIGRRVEPHFARFGLSQGRFTTLVALRRKPDHQATPAELADHLSVTRATVTGLLDGLEADGLVERSHRKDDRRSVSVAITKKGLSTIEKMLPDHYARIGLLMKKLTRQEKKQLTVLLGKVREGVAEADGDADAD